MHPTNFPTDILLSIFDYLNAKELCRCALVCRKWNQVCGIVQNSRWKKLFYEDFGHIFQNKSAEIYSRINNQTKDTDGFLMNVFQKERTIHTWKDQYRVHFVWYKLWKLRSEEVSPVFCGCINKQLLDNSIIHVGYHGCRYTTIREAMSVIQPYCTIFVGPGVYDEQMKFSVMMPIQIVGNSDETMITVSLEFDCTVSRLCNLTLRNPWFTDVLVKVKTGLLMIESCRLYGGDLFISSPGLLAMRYSTLNSTKLIFLKSFCSFVQNCEFNNSTGNTTEFVRIDGAPKYERLNPCCAFLTAQRNAWMPCSESGEDRCTEDNVKEFEYLKQRLRKTKSFEDLRIHDSNSIPTSTKRMLSTSSGEENVTMYKHHTVINVDQLKDTKLLHTSPYSSHQSNEASIRMSQSFRNKRNNSFDEILPSSTTLQAKINKQQDKVCRSINQSNYCEMIRETVKKKEIKEFISNIKGPVFVNCIFTNSQTGITATMESNFTIVNSLMCNCGETIKISRFSKALVYHCRIQDGIGTGICLKKGSEAIVMGNEIFGMTDNGVEVRKNTLPFIMANKIHNNGKVGISFLANGGWTEYNDINGNNTGISLLHGSKPVIRSNTISSSTNTGILINERSLGVIEENHISRNRQSNIIVSKYSAPAITNNHISKSDSDGILFTDICSGSVSNNMIEENSGSGILLINGALPSIYGNQIFRNASHGISIENTIERQRDSMATWSDENHVEIKEGFRTYGSYVDSELDNIDGFGVSNGSNKLNKLFSGEQWIRRRLNLFYIQYNSIYLNGGCGIISETNCPLELSDNAIHSNSQSGIYLKVPGLFGPSFGFPRVRIPKLNSNDGISLSNSNSMNLLVKRTKSMNKMKMFVFANNSSDIRTVDMPTNLYHGESKDKIRQRTIGQILKNSITDNGANGITIQVTHLTSGRFVIFGNGIYGNSCYGIDVHGECEIISNDIIGNTKSAVHINAPSWTNLRLNRLLSPNHPAIFIEDVSSVLVSTSNIVYTATLETDVIRVATALSVSDTEEQDTNDSEQPYPRIKEPNLSLVCFNQFRITSFIEYFPDNITPSTSLINISRAIKNISKQSFSKSPESPTSSNALSSTPLHTSQDPHISQLQTHPMRPCIIHRDRYRPTHVSLALSEALSSLSRNQRSEICLIL